MPEISEKLKISEVSDSEDERLRELTYQYNDTGWKKTLTEVTNEVLENPGWLIEKEYLTENTIHFVQNLLNRIKSEGLKNIDQLIQISHDQPSCNAFVVRFLEIFSEKYDFPYIWRGGSLSDVEGKLRGTFTFSVGEAKGFVHRSYDGPRLNPCLIALPVKAVVEHFKTSKSKWYFVAEHGYDGMFSGSFDCYLPEVPDGTIIYFPD